MTDRKRYQSALVDHLVGQYIPVILDALEGADVEAAINVYGNGTTQITLKGEPANIQSTLGAWADGLAQMHAWND